MYSPLEKNEIISALRSTHGISVHPDDLAKESGTITVEGVRASLHFTLRCCNVETGRGWDVSLYSMTPPEWEKPLGIKSKEGHLSIGIQNMAAVLKVDEIEFIGRYPAAEKILKINR